MEALCRIKLLEPYRNDPACVVPLGNGQRSLIPIGSGAFSVTDPACHVGFNSEQTGVPDQNRFRAAQDVVYELRYDDEGIIVPLSCAMVHFGDWSIKPGDTSQSGTKRTYQQEKLRVAMQWGDYRRMPRGRKTQQGIGPDTRIIGAPDVPKVRIEILEQNGHAYGEPYEPWKFYHWQDDIDVEALREANLIAQEIGVAVRPQPAASFDLSQLSAAQLEMLAEMIAKKARRGGKEAAV